MPSDARGLRRASIAVLAIGVLASGALLLSLDSRLTFIADDWELLVAREGWAPDVFLTPFHENIVLGPALVFKSLLAVFGMSSALPFYIVSISLFLLSAVLLFLYLRTRVGDWVALIGALSILFLGAAFEDLLWAFQLGYFGAMAAGLGMLLALDRDDERGDWIACGLLVASLAFSSLGLVFVVGALVSVLLGNAPRGRRLYVALLPLALLALWWIGWGHEAERHVSWENLAHLPSWVFDAAAAGITSLLGLATNDGSQPEQAHLIWGQVLVPVAAGLVALRAVRDREISRGLAVALAIALAFWVLAGLNRSEERFPTSSRYQYPSAIFLLLIAGEALRGLRLPRLAVVLAAVVVAAAAVGGVSLMQREHEDRWEPVADSIRSSLTAVDLAGPSARPDFPVVFPPNITVPARRYLTAVADHGSPALTEAELGERPEAERAGADLTMAQALGLALLPPRSPALRCQRLTASAAGETGITLLRGQFTIENQARLPVEVMLGRFSGELSVSLGPVDPGITTSLRVPPDDAAQPWRLGLIGAGPVRLCVA
jgi:hypothetical protein